MTNADALRLIETYRLSWYADRDNIPSSRVTAGFKVPILRGDDLTRAMIENVEECRDDVNGTRARFERAQRDGLFDVEMIKLASRPVKAEWIKAAQAVKGDFERAKAELDHWRDYARWAMSEQVTTLRNAQGSGPLVRGLAEQKSGALPSSASMPITDEERNDGIRRVEAQIAEWRSRQREYPPDPRLPPEREPGEDDLDASETL